jgi:phosphoglycolate phosphatase-like HAD superfamily hydrolase
MDEQATETLVLFDFDGTLCRLATDYSLLRRELAAIASDGGLTVQEGLLDQILELEGNSQLAARAAAAVVEAERAGLRDGDDVPRGIELYRAFVLRGATIGVVSHNGREVIEDYFGSRALPPPDRILDRRELAGRKDQSEAVLAYVRQVGPTTVYVVGDGEADRALARRLAADYIEVADE